MRRFLWSLVIVLLLLGSSLALRPATATTSSLGIAHIHATAEPSQIASSDSLRSSLFAPQVGLEITFQDSTLAETPRARLASNQPEDHWFSPDKFLHASISFLVTVSAQYAYEDKLGMSSRDALPLSMLSASVVGIGKEIYDWQLGPRRYFSVKDLVANSVGIMLAALFVVV